MQAGLLPQGLQLRECGCFIGSGTVGQYAAVAQGGKSVGIGEAMRQIPNVSGDHPAATHHTLHFTHGLQRVSEKDDDQRHCGSIETASGKGQGIGIAVVQGDSLRQALPRVGKQFR